jgi:hypothetical protein
LPLLDLLQSLLQTFTFHHHRPVFYIAFLGLPFGKKNEEKEDIKSKAVTIMSSDNKEQLDKADVIFDDNKVSLKHVTTN